MNKQDFVNNISEKLGKTKKDVSLIIDCLLEEMVSALKNEGKITLTNFGVFEKSITKPIDIFSPYDGKKLRNISQTRVHFKSSKYLKEQLK